MSTIGMDAVVKKKLLWVRVKSMRKMLSCKAF